MKKTADIFDVDVRKTWCLEKSLNFCRYMFRHNVGQKFIVNRHHEIICDALDKVFRGEITRLIINLPPRYSKCIAPDTRILTKRGLIAAKDVCVGDTVYSFDGGKCIEAICQGTEPARKDSVKIRMRSGREIICSSDHPMLSTFGYEQAQNLKVGDRIVALRTTIDGGYEVPDNELVFASMMLFDGCCRRTPTFSKNDRAVLDTMEAACDSLGLALKQYPYSAKCDYHIVAKGRKEPIARKLLEKYGLFEKKSTEKRIPSDWFALSERQKLMFIDIMFATDGYIAKQSGQGGITLANKGLIQDIQHILSSLGIISTMNEKPNNYSGAWALTISRAEMISLLERISFYQKRPAAASLLKKKPVFITDTLPYSIIPHEKLTFKCGKGSGIRCCSSKDITRDKFVRLIEKFPQLSKYLHEDFYYDKIVAIDDIGVRELIHIGVDKTHNFIANGLVSHNTQLFVKTFIPMGLAINPRARFIHLSYSDDLVNDNSRDIQNTIRMPEYQELFDALPLQTNTRKWYTKEGGGLYAVSSSGQVTGFGAGLVDPEDAEQKQDLDEFTSLIDKSDGFGGAIVIDDPIKPDDALSDTIREKINDKFETTIRNRVNSRKTPIILIQQRLHEHDLSGYLQQIEPDDWTVISLPAIQVDADGNETALWPHKHTLEELRKIEAANSFVFETQYLQNPTPIEGLMYREFRTYDVIPFSKRAKKKNYTDTADTGNDYLCSICYDELPEGNFVTDILYTKKPMEFTEPKTAEMLAKNKTQEAIIESNNGGRGFARNVERLSREMGNTATSFRWFAQTQNKQVRIFTHSADVNNITYFPADWERRWPEFAMAVKSYRKEGRNANDDAPDVLTAMVERRRPAVNPNLTKEDLGIF